MNTIIDINFGIGKWPVSFFWMSCWVFFVYFYFLPGFVDGQLPGILSVESEGL